MLVPMEAVVAAVRLDDAVGGIEAAHVLVGVGPVISPVPMHPEVIAVLLSAGVASSASVTTYEVVPPAASVSAEVRPLLPAATANVAATASVHNNPAASSRLRSPMGRCPLTLSVISAFILVAFIGFLLAFASETRRRSR